MSTQEQLLIDIDELLRIRPDRETLRHPTDENYNWFGRAAAIVEEYDSIEVISFNLYLSQFRNTSLNSIVSGTGLDSIMTLLHKIRHRLRMNITGATSIAISQGGVFDYFDEIRKTIELANQEVFFVDPYLDAEFVSRYLPHVRTGVLIRLLTSDKKLSTLLPAIDTFAQQNKCIFNLRSTSGSHDRYLFADKANCYHSGASFKDGAKLAPTTLTQITDAFSAVWQTYENLWNAANVVR